MCLPFGLIAAFTACLLTACAHPEANEVPHLSPQNLLCHLFLRPTRLSGSALAPVAPPMQSNLAVAGSTWELRLCFAHGQITQVWIEFISRKTCPRVFHRMVVTLCKDQTGCGCECQEHSETASFVLHGTDCAGLVGIWSEDRFLLSCPAVSICGMDLCGSWQEKCRSYPRHGSR